MCIKVSTSQWPIRYQYKPEKAGTETITFGVSYAGKVYDALEKTINIKRDTVSFTDSTLGNSVNKNGVKLSFANSTNDRKVSVNVYKESIGELGLFKSYFIDYKNKCSEQTSSQILALLPFAKTDEVTAAMVKKGVEHLVSLQNTDGGWGVWSSSSTLEYNSIYAYYALNEAHKLGYDVDSAVLNKAQEYVANRISGTTQSAVLPYVYYILAQTNNFKPSEAAVYYDNNKNNLTYADRAYLLATLSLFAKSDQITILQKGYVEGKMSEIANALWSETKKTSEFVYWKETSAFGYYYNNDVKTNAVATYALLETWGKDARLFGNINYLRNLVKQRNLGTNEMYAVYATLNKAQELFAGDVNKIENVKVIVNGKEIEVKSSDNNGLQYEIALDNSTVLAEVIVNSPDLVYFEAESSYSQKVTDVMGRDKGVSVSTEIIDFNGKHVDVLNYGALYKVRAYISSTDDLQQAAFEIPLPAGLEAVNFNLNMESELLSAEQDSGNADTLGFSFANYEIRPEGLVVYTGDSLYNQGMKKGIHEYTFIVRATRRGKFTVAGASMSEMYMPGRSSVQRASTIEVR